MFSFSYRDEHENSGIQDAKIQRLPPTFNSRNVLQFDLSPD